VNAHLENLEPTRLWQHFRIFCNTPRPSGREAALAAKIEAWAAARGLAYARDDAGNLRIEKPASSGCEGRPGVVLQGHLDMVAQRAPGVDHDFERDPIETTIDDGWLRALGTTLGADNGVGAAAALAILDDDALIHGPLEVLLTVQEEVSLVGARELAPGWLTGRVLLNLDSEEEGVVYIGCAGGTNVTSQTQLTDAPLDASTTVLNIGVHSLQGGHSGLDIHKGLGNANRLLARLLDLLCDAGLRLVDYDGGTMDNAITREAWATMAVDSDRAEAVSETVAAQQAIYRDELAGVDDRVTLACEPATANRALSAADTRRLVGLLFALPYGVEAMSHSAPGVVETSNNIGVVQLHDQVLRTQLMVRSLRDSQRNALARRIAALIQLAGFTAAIDAGYPGWTPEPESPLLARFIRVHEAVAGEPPAVKVIHAGLECGLIGAKYPGMQMISFGPTIRGAHSPDERVHLEAVVIFYDVLRAFVADLAAQ
jgi:dipeptidase D